MEKSRQCGACRLCCKTLYIGERGTHDGVPYEFVHYPGTWCKHASERGCTLHTTPLKPLACRTFQCLWLLGVGRDEDRPDKIKFVTTIEERAGRLSEDGPLEEPATHIIVYDSVYNAHKSKRAARFMEELYRLFERAEDIMAIEFVPADPGHTVRHGIHKTKGHLEIHLQGWPELMDADVEADDLKAVLGAGDYTDLGGLIERVSKETRVELLNRINARRRTREAKVLGATSPPAEDRQADPLRGIQEEG